MVSGNIFIRPGAGAFFYNSGNGVADSTDVPGSIDAYGTARPCDDPTRRNTHSLIRCAKVAR